IYRTWLPLIPSKPLAHFWREKGRTLLSILIGCCTLVGVFAAGVAKAVDISGAQYWQLVTPKKDSDGYLQLVGPDARNVVFSLDYKSERQQGPIYQAIVFAD